MVKRTYSQIEVLPYSGPQDLQKGYAPVMIGDLQVQTRERGAKVSRDTQTSLWNIIEKEVTRTNGNTKIKIRLDVAKVKRVFSEEDGE